MFSPGVWSNISSILVERYFRLYAETAGGITSPEADAELTKLLTLLGKSVKRYSRAVCKLDSP
jgi:hypothetical protein